MIHRRLSHHAIISILSKQRDSFNIIKKFSFFFHNASNWTNFVREVCFFNHLFFHAKHLLKNSSKSSSNTKISALFVFIIKRIFCFKNKRSFVGRPHQFYKFQFPFKSRSSIFIRNFKCKFCSVNFSFSGFNIISFF